MKQICNFWSIFFFFTGLFFLISFKGFSQNTFVPDDNFEQALIDLGYDSGPLDDNVPTANIVNETNLDLSGFINKITNLTGIEDFTALIVLNFENHLVNNVNINQNINLEFLFCNNNLLTNLDISNNTNLRVIWCNNNQLTGIDVTNNKNLRVLDCSFNQITNLNVTENTLLLDFVCEGNLITNLDLTNNSFLRLLQCGNNLLNNIDVSTNTNLLDLYCEQNQLTHLNLASNSLLKTIICYENELLDLDLTQNISLLELDCSYNNICHLNIKNGNNSNLIKVNFSSNINLNCVIVDNPSNTHTNFIPTTFSNYVSSINDCNSFVNIDTLSDVITNTTYTLPTLTYGNYYTEPNGNGTMLSSGDIITTSQEIYIYNNSICANNESNFYVFINDKSYYIPKFFTPNNDGKHDFWKVIDDTNSITSITIFNRYGKLLKYLTTSSQSWDGTFNGNYLQTDNYWYIIKLNSGENIKGYFTLKR